MKNTLLIALTAALLASCAPKSDDSGTTGTAATDSATTTDTAGSADMGTDTSGSTATDTTGSAGTDAVGSTDASGATGTDTTSGTDTADTSTGGSGTDTAGGTSGDDNGNTGTGMEMGAGEAMTGTVSNFDSSARTFTLNANGQDYNVSVDDATTFEGGATNAQDFFGSGRDDANISVEGSVTGQELVARTITLN